MARKKESGDDIQVCSENKTEDPFDSTLPEHTAPEHVTKKGVSEYSSMKTSRKRPSFLQNLCQEAPLQWVTLFSYSSHIQPPTFPELSQVSACIDTASCSDN